MENQQFEDILEFPEPYALDQYRSLVGLDEHKSRLIKEASLMVAPGSLAQWCNTMHGDNLPLVSYIEDRPPLFIFAGDVGTGKTALAKSFGAEVARKLRMKIWLYPMSLQSRGSGAVGEMTQRISAAFRTIVEEGAKFQGGKRGIILLIDEADAIAQSREFKQMHHEDRAGVNALLRGIDELAAKRLPVTVVMCTNRSDALDPAVKRRSACIFRFERPNEDQRRKLLLDALEGLNMSANEISELVNLTGGTPGYTYSDFRQRFFPAIVLEAYPDSQIDYSKIRLALKKTPATPQFSQAE